MAITAFATSPVLGISLDGKGTALTHAVGTAVYASDGRKYMYASATSAYSSTAVLIIGSGAALTCLTAASAGAASYLCKTTGGVAANTHFWAKSKKNAALS